MEVAGRSIKTLLASLRETRHWRALVNMARLYPAFAQNLRRYLTRAGDYPYECRVRTPLGEVAPRLYCHDDLLTLNEIFCRQDYGDTTDARVVIDIGANIGISALYFLTRNAAARCYLYEPDPRNVKKLRHNLRDFEGRYRLFECAVADVTGQQRFGIEATGRYGSLDSWGTEVIRVACRHVDDVLRQCLDAEGHIDLLKIDTEGAELRTVRAIAPELLGRVDRIVLECEESPELPGFREVVYGSVRRLRRAHATS